MVDLDNILKYASPKYVYIRNAKLGILKYFFMVCIFFYVVLYEIVYSCVHLTPHHASGFGEIGLQHPTKKCDPLDSKCLAQWSSISEKKYCSQSASARVLGDKAEEAPAEEGPAKDTKDSNKAKIGEEISTPLKCRYFDSFRATWVPPQPSEIFIPTMLEEIHQEISEDCYDPEIGGIKGSEGGRSSFDCARPWVTKKKERFYMANIEDFDLNLQHTFEQADIGVAGTSVDYQGFLAACKSNHPDSLDECIRMRIPNSDGDAADEDLVGLTSAEEEGIESLTGTPKGDQIRFGDLLKVTPVAQEHGLDNILDAELPDYFEHPGKSLREVGGLLLLDVNYDNFGYLRPGITIGGFPSSFNLKPITYTYRAYFLPMRTNVKIQLIGDGDFPHKRTVDKWYGVTIKMQFNGKLVMYSTSEVLTALSSGLILVTSATTLVMYLAAYLLPLKEKYCLLMYQLSEDFSDYIFMKHNRTNKDRAQSSYATGQLILDKLQSADQSLTNKEKLQILCAYEMRLNRLDGMDPKCVFEAGDDDDEMNHEIGEMARQFYKDQGLTDQQIDDNMSYRVKSKVKSTDARAKAGSKAGYEAVSQTEP
mmetsp:Transcript_47126/g.74446  ORF Transcript_47126/g.74446 Transcript_47126/m.74446 type:complete len:592 (-) Transcript_47126:167-1942(-)